jgi:hypothetical protein
MKEQYENEVNQLLATLDQLGIPKTTEGLTDHLFGDKSRLMQSLVKALGKEAHEIHQFLATIYFAAELGLPAHRLQKHPNIKYDKYMDKDALNSFWNISVTDTLQQLRERANKYLAFHDSLGILSKFHLNASQSSQASNSVQEDVNSQTYAMKPAPRFDKNAKRKQFSVNHSILGDSLGGTPIGKSKGKGRSKQFLDSKPNSFAIKQREDSCKGFLGRIFLDNGKKGGDFDLDRRQSCDLCKARNVTTMCAGCKRVLCFDKDRRERILNLLEGEDGDELRERFPALANLRRRDVPLFYTEIGRVGDKRFVMGLSCWHLSHPSHFCSPCNDMDGQLSHVAASGEGIDSPQAL